MLILRTSNPNGTSYNGFQWPQSGPVEAPDWDPKPECGNGLHGLVHGRGDPRLLCWGINALWQVIEVEDETIVDLKGKVKFPKGNVIYSGDQEGALDLIAGGGGIRKWVCEDPHWAFLYAQYVDETPRDDTREATLKDPYWAYKYAQYVDKVPRDDTRKATLKDPQWAFSYAHYVDKVSRDDTREATLKDPYLAFSYAQYVDETPRDDTRKAALKDPYLATKYEEWEASLGV